MKSDREKKLEAGERYEESQRKTIQSVKKEARALYHDYYSGENLLMGLEVIDKIVELSAKAHEEATRLSKQRGEMNSEMYNFAVDELNRKSKQFFEEV